MNLETQRKNIVHRILDIDNEQLLSQIEELLNKEVHTFTTSGKPLSTEEYKNHLTGIMRVSEAGEPGFTTHEARKKISRK